MLIQLSIDDYLHGRREIQLIDGPVAIVDVADYDWLNQWRWRSLGKQRATREYELNGKRIFVTMHRLIMNAPRELQVDHINGNGLDNRRCNLRLATASQNIRNQFKRSNTTSRYKGVSWNKKYRKWYAAILPTPNSNPRHLGSFDSEIEAAVAYNNAASKYFGAFANLNVIDWSDLDQ